MNLQTPGWLRVSLALLTLLVLSVPGLAQQSEDGPWYDVPALDAQKPYIQWIFGSLFVVACLLIAFKNPHRSHLD